MPEVVSSGISGFLNDEGHLHAEVVPEKTSIQLIDHSLRHPDDMRLLPPRTDVPRVTFLT